MKFSSKFSLIAFIVAIVASTSFSSCKAKKATCPAYRGIDQTNTEFKPKSNRSYSLFPSNGPAKKKKKKK